MDTKRRGQALMELATGLFAVALVVSALCGFAVYIAKSLEAQNSLRHGNGGTNIKSDKVPVEEFASKYVFGTRSLKIEEKVVMPQNVILK